MTFSVNSPVSSPGRIYLGYRFKRLFDIILSGIGLIASSPLWLLFSLVIKIEGAGPVFHGQERVGIGGNAFKSWKFRTMVPDSDQKFGPLQASENDHRITHVGRILRATALDELPQLWNILKGDMSFVGPRALLPREIEIRQSRDEPSFRTAFHAQSSTFCADDNKREGVVALEEIPGYSERHSVRPGLTGLAQVYAPRDIPRRQKFKYDLLYIRNQSFWLDLRIIFLSFWITCRGKWESRAKKF